MPWKPADAKKKTKKANTPGRQAQWAAIANRLLASGASEGSAIRQANGAIREK